MSIFDDRLLRIGSANLNNRSGGLDTELDAAIDFLPAPPACDRIVTHRLGLESAAEALALAADAANASKVVVEVR